MATYLKIEGINGNVQSKNHKEWIELKSLNFAINRHINTLPGQVYDRQLSRPSLSEIEVTKSIDNSSVLLFQASCSAKSIKTALIDLCQTNQSSNAYAQLKLENVIVTAYKLSDDSNRLDKRPVEHIKLSFDAIEYRYTPYSGTNKAMSPQSARYNLKTAVAG